MIENNNDFRYLDMELMEKMCHKLAVAIFDTREDPIANFHEHTDLLDSALNLPKHDLGYPTLIDKAAILYYVLNKNHPFKNGNKRIAATSLVVFLFINDKWLLVKNEELYEKTLYIAKSDRTEKDKIVLEVKQWIKKSLIPLKEIIDELKNEKRN